MKADKHALIAKGIEKHLEYKASERREREIALIQAEARVQAVLDARNIFLASLVDDQGFSVREVGTRILDTSNWKTADDAVKAGRKLRLTFAEEAAAVEQPIQSGPYRWNVDEQCLTVTLPQEAFEPYERMLVRHPKPEGETWDFYIVDGKLTPNFSEDDATWEEPIVTVVMNERGKKDALAFIAEQTKEAA